MSSEFKYYFTKLTDIEKQLGGNNNKSRLKHLKNNDEFKYGELKVFETIKHIQKLQDDLDKNDSENAKNKIFLIKINSDIRSGIIELKKQIDELERVLNKQRNKKKITPENIESKNKRLSNYKVHLSLFENYLQGGSIIVTEQQEPMTLEQMKLELINEGVIMRSKEDELTIEERKALEIFIKKDKEIDEVAIEIDIGLEELLKKVNNISEGIQHTHIKIENNIVEVDKTRKELDTTNKKLKKLIDHYRKPYKFCMDIICLIILLGLAAVLYNMLKK